ncbi:MAG TPA: cell division protein FtsB [Xanthomonadaceae bacterium]|jgi:cell division protein FtsB
MYRLLALILLVVIVGLQYKLWQGEGSWTSEQSLKQQVEEQRIENARLKQRNAALVAEVEDLKSGEAAVEERARSEMGMVKPGETFYRVVEQADPNANVAPEDVPEDAASPASGSQSSNTQSSGTQSSSSGTQSPAALSSPSGTQSTAPGSPRSPASGKQASPPNPQASKK